MGSVELETIVMSKATTRNREPDLEKFLFANHSCLKFE